MCNGHGSLNRYVFNLDLVNFDIVSEGLICSDSSFHNYS